MHEPADYYRRPERGTADYHQGIVEHTQRLATAFADGPAAARLLADRGGAALRSWGAADLNQVVKLAHGAIRLSDYVVTRLISHAAHGVDLAISLHREPWTTPAALTVIRPVLLSLLGHEPPAQLSWDDATLFTVATGRRRLGESERAALDGKAPLFPLIS